MSPKARAYPFLVLSYLLCLHIPLLSINRLAPVLWRFSTVFHKRGQYLLIFGWSRRWMNQRTDLSRLHLAELISSLTQGKSPLLYVYATRPLPIPSVWWWPMSALESVSEILIPAPWSITNIQHRCSPCAEYRQIFERWGSPPCHPPLVRYQQPPSAVFGSSRKDDVEKLCQRGIIRKKFSLTCEFTSNVYDGRVNNWCCIMKVFFCIPA